jgi:hypothetical protein
VIKLCNIIDFASAIQELLSRPFSLEKDGEYLDLAQISSINKELLLKKVNIPPQPNPIAEAVSLVIETMKGCHLTRTKIGINEILKTYLLIINHENEKECTELFSGYLYEIYLYSLQKNYPYTDLLWNYLSNCFHVVSLYLVEAGYVEGCKIFLQQIATMGKMAAQKGLHTSSIQHFLHTLELKAQELGFTEFAAVAKNHRFNLEIF